LIHFADHLLFFADQCKTELTNEKYFLRIVSVILRAMKIVLTNAESTLTNIRSALTIAFPPKAHIATRANVAMCAFGGKR